MNETKKQRSFAVDRDKRTKRRNATKLVERTHALKQPRGGERFAITKTIETSAERAESLSIVREMAQSFASTIEFYKADHGGAKPHDEAVKETLSISERRRSYVERLPPEEVNWAHITAVGQTSMQESVLLWARVREAADDDLESGRFAAKVTGVNTHPHAIAQFLAIRDSFADQWQPTGGIESAMIDMMTIAFSLQMYWATIAHQRAIAIHNDQSNEVELFESKGWKAPYQCAADAVEQAHRLADGYNRQFLRVLRQLRDLRRYAPVIIQNNGGQVNVGAQQVNVKQ